MTETTTKPYQLYCVYTYLLPTSFFSMLRSHVIDNCCLDTDLRIQSVVISSGRLFDKRLEVHGAALLATPTAARTDAIARTQALNINVS